jgi:type VI secretion system protein VasD
MPAHIARLFTLTLAILCLAVSACGTKPPKPVKARLSIEAAADANPDSAGRPSPVVVRIYQLKDDAAFGNADFFAIFDQEDATLAGVLVGREEFMLAPGDQRKAEFAVSRDAKFVAVAAAFRDIRNSQWRVLQPAPKKGLTNIVKKDALAIVVEKTRVTLAVAD